MREEIFQNFLGNEYPRCQMEKFLDDEESCTFPFALLYARMTKRKLIYYYFNDEINEVCCLGNFLGNAN